jgi:hypothetical protein
MMKQFGASTTTPCPNFGRFVTPNDSAIAA